MADIERHRTPNIGGVSNGLSRRTERTLSRLSDHTLVAIAEVQAEGLVQNERLHEIDRLARSAMTGQAMLAKWRDTLAAGDPFLTDELRFFTDVARMGKGEVIANTIDCFTRGC
jgi:hypothetical protein